MKCNMRRLAAIIFGACIVVCWGPGIGLSGEMDILLKKLVEKKILTQQEAQEVLKETQEEVKKEEAKQKDEVKKAEKKPKDWLPAWVAKTKISGDIRLRYQYENTTDQVDRNRARIRYRLAISNQVTDNIKVGLRVASGDANPRSTEQTLGDTFSDKPINLNRAFAEFRFFDMLTLTGGKYGLPLWLPWDMLWDSDINPEGVTAALNYAPFYANASFWILDERSGSSHDPFMVPVQIGWTPKFDRYYLKTALTGYFFQNVQDNTLEYSAGTNTLNDDGTLKYNYSSIDLAMEFGVNDIAKFLPRVALYGSTMYNPDPNDLGWIAGIKLGAKDQPRKFGEWEFFYNYRYLERDAWLDTFPDSNAYGGATNIKGHEWEFRYGLMTNTFLTLDFYWMKYIDGPEDEQKLGQAEITVKF